MDMTDYQKQVTEALGNVYQGALEDYIADCMSDRPTVDQLVKTIKETVEFVGGYPIVEEWEDDGVEYCRNSNDEVYTLKCDYQMEEGHGYHDVSSYTWITA
jgi:hypothetical protein